MNMQQVETMHCDFGARSIDLGVDIGATSYRATLYRRDAAIDTVWALNSLERYEGDAWRTCALDSNDATTLLDVLEGDFGDELLVCWAREARRSPCDPT